MLTNSQLIINSIISITWRYLFADSILIENT